MLRHLAHAKCSTLTLTSSHPIKIIDFLSFSLFIFLWKRKKKQFFFSQTNRIIKEKTHGSSLFHFLAGTIFLLCVLQTALAEQVTPTTPIVATTYISTTSEPSTLQFTAENGQPSGAVTQLPTSSSTAQEVSTAATTPAPSTEVEQPSTTLKIALSTIVSTSSTSKVWSTTTNKVPETTTKFEELPTTTTITTTTEVVTTTTVLPTTTKKAAAVDFCLLSHNLEIEAKPNDDFYVNVTKGDIVITIISTKYTSAPFVARRINELKLIRENVTIGE